MATMTMTIQLPSDTTSLAAVAVESTCGCGQALELCHTAHCPRCGTTLHA